MEVLGGVLIFGAVAAANVAAAKTQPQMNPAVPHLQAFFAAIRRFGLNRCGSVFQVTTELTVHECNQCLMI